MKNLPLVTETTLRLHFAQQAVENVRRSLYHRVAICRALGGEWRGSLEDGYCEVP
ncbi:hypothetical protein [Thermosulfurimonas sp. F29]|uniref:hypothetical protein n=1 Tax=Thermosulfurimonas sp. F29 TaxID=2867247 RepID=UPI001C8331E8|nr:hypothetical protein [Thermosulfurimonas sp. F29]MBX6423411.1 hypothetical protein [Thermosulfurimonas sp. F29]